MTLDVNGGDALQFSEVEITFNENYNLPIPTMTGYNFIGWYFYDIALTDKNGESLQKSSLYKDETLIAHWEAKKFNITVVT